MPALKGGLHTKGGANMYQISFAMVFCGDNDVYFEIDETDWDDLVWNPYEGEWEEYDNSQEMYEHLY